MSEALSIFTSTPSLREILFFLPLAFLLGYIAIKLRGMSRLAALREERIHRMQEEKRAFFSFLHELGECIQEDFDQHHLIETILSLSTKVTGADSGIIYLVKDDGAHLITESIVGLFPPPFVMTPAMEERVAARPEYLHTILRNEPLKLSGSDASFFGTICYSGSPVWITDAASDPRFPKSTNPSLKLDSLIGVPLKYRQELLGVIALAKQGSHKGFTLSDFEMAKSVATQASFSLYNATVYRQLAEKQRLDRDLQVAREIQRILLPQENPQIPGYELAAVNQPAQRVSGDYYDFLQIDEDHLGIVIADVSGKGVPASLIMAMCRTVMRTQATDSHSAAAVLRKVNRLLFPDIREDMFITMAYMILDLKNNTLNIAKAGHDAPLICRGGGRAVEAIQSPGMALGIDSGEVFDNVLKDVVVPLEPRDTILVYTDGISEATDPDGQEFGRDLIKSTMLQGAPSGVQQVVDDLLKRVATFSAGTPQNDDITLVVLQKK